ncbi:MAG: hypothetical protein FWD74_09610, partial [Actinomycetia bacterium]|nr:hypothetical protein [Actinomycetes bacterium]
GRVSGRARDGRLVHLRAAAGPGDTVTTTVTGASAHYLVADGEPRAVRPWRGPESGRTLPVLTITRRAQAEN